MKNGDTLFEAFATPVEVGQYLQLGTVCKNDTICCSIIRLVRMDRVFADVIRDEQRFLLFEADVDNGATQEHDDVFGSFLFYFYFFISVFRVIILEVY